MNMNSLDRQRKVIMERLFQVKATSDNFEKDSSLRQEFLRNIYLLFNFIGYCLSFLGRPLVGDQGLVDNPEVVKVLRSYAPLGLLYLGQFLAEFIVNSQKFFRMLKPENYLAAINFSSHDDEGYLSDFVNTVLEYREYTENILIAMEALLDKNREEILADRSLCPLEFQHWLNEFDQMLKTNLGLADWIYWPDAEMTAQIQQRYYWYNVVVKRTQSCYVWFLQRFVFEYDFSLQDQGRFEQFILRYVEAAPEYIDRSKLLDRLLLRWNPLRWLWWQWQIRVACRLSKHYKFNFDW